MTLSLLVYLPKSQRLRQSLSKPKCLVMMLKGPVNMCASEPVTNDQPRRSSRQRWLHGFFARLCYRLIIVPGFAPA